MSTAVLPTSGFPITPPVAVSSVFLPKEHGSWSLALEPIALGLLIAPSWAGGALAGAALAGFFARRPLKASLSPVQSPRRQAARETLVMWSALAVAGLFEAGVLGGWNALWPLLPAAGLGGVFIYFDTQNEARAAAAEVAGSAAFALVPATLALLAGQPGSVALALAVLAVARSVPAILTVRAYLRAMKGGPIGRAPALISSLAACGALVALAVTGLAASCAGLLGALLLARAVWLVGPWRPAWSARRIGMAETAVGLLYVALFALNWPLSGT